MFLNKKADPLCPDNKPCKQWSINDLYYLKLVPRDFMYGFTALSPPVVN